MIGTPRTLCRTSLLAVCVVLGVGWEARAQHQHDDLGSVSFPTSSPAVGAGRVQPRRRDAPLLLVQLRGQDLPQRARAGSGVHHRLLGCGARPPRQHAVGAAVSGRGQAAWEALERPARCRSRRNASTTGSTRRAPTSGTSTRRSRCGFGLYAGDGEGRQGYPEDFEAQVYYALTLQARRRRRPDVCQSVDVGGDAREALRLQPAASRHHALFDSRLRLRAVCRARHPGRATIRCDRAGSAARPPHAGTHLLDGRTLGGFDRVQPLALEIQPDYYHAVRLHGVRASSAGDRTRRPRASIEQALATPLRGDRPPARPISPRKRRCPPATLWSAPTGRLLRPWRSPPHNTRRPMR